MISMNPVKRASEFYRKFSCLAFNGHYLLHRWVYLNSIFQRMCHPPCRQAVVILHFGFHGGRGFPSNVVLNVATEAV